MIQIKEITKSYKDGQNKKLVIDNLNLNICNTGLYTFLGPSGSGKTTILNLISLLDYPDSGDILINDKSILKYTQKEINDYRSNYIDYIFQDFNLFENESVIFNLSMITEDKNKIKEVLHIVSLDNYESRKVSSLSIGEKQRVAIARSIIKDSKILLCDEPTGNLDVENTKLVFELLKELSKTKLVILVTHDVENAKQYSDVIYKLKEGKVEEEIIHKVEEKGESNNSTNNKVRLGLSKIIKLGLSNIRKSLGTFIIAAIIVISQFAACISMISVNSYDKSEAIAKTMKENLMYSAELMLYKDSALKQTYGDNSYIGPQLNYREEQESDVEQIQKENKDNTVATEYFFNVFFDFFSDKKDYKLVEDDSLFVTYFGKITVADTFDKFHQPLLSGRYPKAEGEIVLYDYIIDSLYHYKVIDTTDMVNKTLTYHFMDKEYKMTVVGILKTEYKKFVERYKELENDSLSYNLENRSYLLFYIYSFNNFLCLRETYNKLKAFTEDYFQIKEFVYRRHNENHEIIQSSRIPYNLLKIQKNIKDIENNLLYLDPNFAEKYESGVRGLILSKQMIYRILDVSSDEEFNNLDFNGKKGYDAFLKYFNTSFSYVDCDHNSPDGGSLISNYVFPIFGIVDIELEYPLIINSQGDSYNLSYFHSNIFLSNNWNKSKKIIQKYALMVKKSDSFYDSVDSNWSETKFCIVNHATMAIEKNDKYLKEVKSMTNLISILLFIASFGILFYFSFSSIKENLYKIGLLSSLGCSKFKALSIYLVSFIFLFLISFVAAIPIGFFVVSKINGIYLKNLSSILYFFYVSPMSLFISLMISLGVLAIGIAYPLIKLFKMPIIKTIKGYKIN